MNSGDEVGARDVPKQHVRLRPMTIADADQVLAWRNDREVARYMIDDRPIAPDDHESWMHAVLASSACRYWIIEAERRAVGLAHLGDINLTHRRCAWGFYVGDVAVRGHGIAPTALSQLLDIAFADFGLERLTAEVIAWNERSLALHERIGFTREGLLRAHVHRDDGIYDVVLLSMLRSEWEARYGNRRSEAGVS
jgi:UDP-4-amino-4,6-dideoxy-N-acetyl-beta-L-altrosamine N-acetyltransferase